MAIVTMTREEIDKIMTPERRKRETEEMNRHPIVYDEDCPPMTEERLQRFHRVAPLPSAAV
ncbi:MAG: hypothetical protein IJ631_02175 [Schwartzia sp.]|nr:hypothetical protein [Schwartzia sp. (in: firmicutes)]